MSKDIFIVPYLTLPDNADPNLRMSTKADTRESMKTFLICHRHGAYITLHNPDDKKLSPDEIYGVIAETLGDVAKFICLHISRGCNVTLETGDLEPY